MKNKIESEKYDNYPPQERVLTLFPLSRHSVQTLCPEKKEEYSIPDGERHTPPSCTVSQQREAAYPK